MKLTRTLFASVTALVMALGVAGCSSSSDETMGESSGKPATMPTTGTAASQEKLYDRLGGNAGIKTAVHAIVVEELKDPELASYFFFQVSKPIPAGHPTADQIEECFVLLLGKTAGGPEQYPAKVSGGFECRDMNTAHKTLGIPGGVFTKFNMIAAGVLKGAGVKDDDLKTIGTVLESTREDVAQDRTRQTGSFIQH
jgi:hypothetical protein